MSPEARDTLHALGLEQSIAELRPAPIERTRLFVHEGDELELPLPGDAWGLSRYKLDQALHDAAMDAGAELHMATTVTAVHPIGKGFRIEMKRNGESTSIEARTVIGAWGGARRPGLTSNRPARTDKSYMGIKSHFEGLHAEPVVEMYFFRGGYVGLCPVEGGRVNAAALLERKAFESSEKSVLGFLEEAACRHPALRKRLAGAKPVEGTQAAVSPVHLGAKPHPWGTLPQVGDASVMLPPLCGDGMSMALRSAALCAPLADRYLRGSLSLANWEQEYTRAIQREFTGPLLWGSMLQRLLSVPALAKWLPKAAKLAPGLAEGMVRATRLKQGQT
ncbi:hypothetical protein D3C78_946980 [compost metagenome]